MMVAERGVVEDGQVSAQQHALCQALVRALRRRPSYRLLDIDELPGLFPVGAGTEMAAEAARLRDMHPSDVAGVVRALPLAQRKQLAEAMDDELLAELGIPRAILPEVRSSSEVYGTTDPALFGAPLPIAGIAGDQHAATFGQACFAPGMAKTTYGTGAFLMLNTGTDPVPSANGLLTTLGWQLGPDAPATEVLLYLPPAPKNAGAPPLVSPSVGT